VSVFFVFNGGGREAVFSVACYVRAYRHALSHTHMDRHILNSRCEGVLLTVDGASVLWTIDVICQALKKYFICDYKKKTRGKDILETRLYTYDFVC